MNIRMTDTDDEEQRKEIRHQRSNKDRWIQAVVAAIAAGATYLGGTTYVQMQDVQTDPSARADPFSGKMGEALRADLERQIAAKSAFNSARWDEISKHLETQRAIMEALRASVEGLVSRCAQGIARDEALQQQVSDLRDEVRDDRRILYQHIGLENGHNKK